MGAVDRATALFTATFGVAPAYRVQAPGRVNLIGEHTDYNDGFALPCAIDRGTVIAASPRADGLIRVVAADHPGAPIVFAVQAAFEPHLQARWSDYVRAMACSMAQAGLPICGADLAVAGDLPQGAGLSSSASLQVAVGLALGMAAGFGLAPVRVAQLAQAAENDHVGTRCGIMDQLASAAGQERHALLIDCRSLALEAVPIPTDAVVTIVHSGVSRGLVEGAYNERRAQCETAARLMGVAALRDADTARLESFAGRLDPVVFRRARHVITENARTLLAADALKAGDLRRLGMLMAASHASMRDDFEITVPAMDRLVAVLQGAIGDGGGARMTGGGFGGAAVAVCDAAAAERARNAVLTAYRTPSGAPPMILTTRPSAGAGLV